MSTGIKPVRVAAIIVQLDSQAATVKAPNMMGHSAPGNPLFNPARSIYIEVSGIAGTGIGVVYALAVLPRHDKVGKFCAVDNNKIYRLEKTALQVRKIRQVILMDDGFVHWAEGRSQPSCSSFLKSMIAALARAM